MNTITRIGEARIWWYFMLYGVPSEQRVRELAAAFHAALYGDLGPLRRAVPGADVAQDGDAAC